MWFPIAWRLFLLAREPPVFVTRERRLRHLEDERLELMRKAADMQSKAVRYKMLAAKVSSIEFTRFLYELKRCHAAFET